MEFGRANTAYYGETKNYKVLKFNCFYTNNDGNCPFIWYKSNC